MSNALAYVVNTIFDSMTDALKDSSFSSSPSGVGRLGTDVAP